MPLVARRGSKVCEEGELAMLRGQRARREQVKWVGKEVKDGASCQLCDSTTNEATTEQPHVNQATLSPTETRLAAERSLER